MAIYQAEWAKDSLKNGDCMSISVFIPPAQYYEEIRSSFGINYSKAVLILKNPHIDIIRPLDVY